MFGSIGSEATSACRRGMATSGRESHHPQQMLIAASRDCSAIGAHHELPLGCMISSPAGLAPATVDGFVAGSVRRVRPRIGPRSDLISYRNWAVGAGAARGVDGNGIVNRGGFGIRDSGVGLVPDLHLGGRL